jgi:glycosyltransferase involved in cell wall biosynthesis
MLQAGEEARICGIGDRAAIAAAVRELLHDEPQRVRLAQAGRQRVAGLTWAAQAGKLNDLYTAWLAEHRARGR